MASGSQPSICLIRRTHPDCGAIGSGKTRVGLLWAIYGVVRAAAADPLNLVGILLPGPRLSPFSGQVIASLAGIPVAMGDLGAVLSHLRSASLQP